MAVMVAVVLEVNKRTRFSVTSVAADRDRVRLYYMASSGIEAAMAMLIRDKATSDQDSVQEDWADPKKVQAVMDALPFESGHVAVVISDELGKIQINSLVDFPEGRQMNMNQENLWFNFLSAVLPTEDLPEESTPNAIINSVKDWLDFGDDNMITGVTGAETPYYQDLDPPYSCADGPFMHIDEIFLVKGVTRDLFGESVDDFSIEKYVTVYGMKDVGGSQFAFEGKININTAPLEVIAALLPPGNVDLAQVIYDFREETSATEYANDLTGTWYLNCPGCQGSGINPKMIRPDSDYFRIESTAVLDAMQLRVVVIVHRQTDQDGKNICKILSRQVEDGLSGDLNKDPKSE